MKILKSSAGYVHFEDTDYHCLDCYKFLSRTHGKVCAEVQGTIAPYGGCNTFVKGLVQVEPIRLPRKLSQGEAGYTENKAGFGCKRCEYFNRSVYDCRKVDKDSEGPDRGMISPDGCCNLWEKSEVFGAIA